jgi:hypothetical protein
MHASVSSHKFAQPPSSISTDDAPIAAMSLLTSEPFALVQIPTITRRMVLCRIISLGNISDLVTKR